MKLFLGVLIFFLVFGWLVLFFSVVGLFYTGIVILSILISFISALLFSCKIPFNPPFLKGEISAQLSPFYKGGVGGRFFFVILISFAVSFTTCYFAAPTVFGGRDQGSIAAAAIELSKNHNLKINNPVAQDLFQKYGPGRALNFPGFDYTKNGNLISRFPLGYTSYLASAYDLFGLKGIQYANFIPLFLFLIIFWLILKEFFNDKISLLGFLIAASFFPFLWFAKYTLTETYTLFLVLIGIYLLIISRGDPISIMEIGSPFLYLSLAFFALSALVRIEGIVFFLLAVIYIFLMSSQAKSKDLYAISNSKPSVIHKDSSTSPPLASGKIGRNDKEIILISAVFLLIIYFCLNFPVLADSAKNLAKAFLPNSTKESAPSFGLYSHLARIFFNYNIFAYLVLGLAGIVWSILSSRAKPRDLQEQSNKPATKISRLAALARNDSIMIFFLTFPAFFYLLTPQITLDDPWLLRRFVFAVFPALIFYSIYFLNKFFYHKIFLYFSLAVLVAANIAVSQRFFTLSENKELLPQIEKISQQFGPDDLILVDRLATGSGYSLASEPLRTLYGKNAVYFFNADDLNHINQNRYNNIYLLAPLLSEEPNPWYASLIKDNPPANGQIITNNFLEPAEKKWSLSTNMEAETLVGIWKLQ